MNRDDSEGGHVDPDDLHFGPCGHPLDDDGGCDFCDTKPCACCQSQVPAADLAVEPGEPGMWGSCCRLDVEPETLVETTLTDAQLLELLTVGGE